MSKQPLPFAVADLSALARSLRGQWIGAGHASSHVELLNMLARASGRRNYQHFRQDIAAGNRLAEAPAIPAPRPDRARIERLLRHFDTDGRLIRWPGRASLQELSLWVFWSRLQRGVILTEQQISARLRDWHLFGDPALLRRALVDYGLVRRTVDGRQYCRIEQRPPAELSPLLALIEQPRDG